MQLLPAIQLRNYVKHYLWLQASNPIDGGLHIFGDGNPGLVFCCEGQLYQNALLLEPLPLVFGYGQINSHRTVYASPNIQLLIVVLQPFALSAALRTPAAELTDLILDPKQLFTDRYAGYASELILPLDISKRIDMLDELLSKLFIKQPDNCQNLIAATLQHISQLEGKVSSEQLMQFTGFSERYLEKKFKEHIGISPKKFSRITRMLKYIKVLKQPEQLTTLTDKAYTAGFFDQAHLNHEFKKLTGVTPTAFRSHSQALALNFFSLQQQ